MDKRRADNMRLDSATAIEISAQVNLKHKLLRLPSK